jgi:hypothetical protein
VKRLVVAMLLLCFAAVAGGAVEYWHDHALAHAAGHDEDHCAVHATLTAARISDGYVPVLVSLGLFVAFLSELPRQLVLARLTLRLDCRGPPASC